MFLLMLPLLLLPSVKLTIAMHTDESTHRSVILFWLLYGVNVDKVFVISVLIVSRAVLWYSMLFRFFRISFVMRGICMMVCRRVVPSTRPKMHDPNRKEPETMTR